MVAQSKKKTKKKKGAKPSHTKTLQVKAVWKDKQWAVRCGKLTSGPGKPAARLFLMVAEKIPYEAIDDVRKHATPVVYPEKKSKRGPKPKRKTINGVYIAHDSMGSPRYIGRGDIFGRLKARKAAQNLELAYFSFYVVEAKGHEREIETILIRAAGPLLEFNDKKKRVGIQPGAIGDYEAGTTFFERQYKKGPRTKPVRS